MEGVGGIGDESGADCDDPAGDDEDDLEPPARHRYLKINHLSEKTSRPALIANSGVTRLTLRVLRPSSYTTEALMTRW